MGEAGAENWDLTGIQLEMVELMGTGYVVEYCVSRYKHKQEEKRYRTYIADVLMHMCNNIAGAFGGNTITTRYVDLDKPVDTRSGDEIAVDVIKRAGLSFAEEE